MNCHGNPKNSCMGAYGNTLDIKITDECNGKCRFCIETGGKKSKSKPVEDLIKAVEVVNPSSVLILGGEPTMYPDLVKLLKNIQQKDRKIFLTTNGSSLYNFALMGVLGEFLDGINISLHHYDLDINYKVTGIDLEYMEIQEAIKILHKGKTQVRINSLLLKGYLDNFDDCWDMADFAGELKADWIRFSEVQQCPSMYVDARTIFDDLTDNPFVDGCEQEVDFMDLAIKATVKLLS